MPRTGNAYSTFVKEHINEFKHLQPKDRMKACAELYHKMKDNNTYKGGSLLGDILPFGNLIGLGLKTKKAGEKAMAKPRSKRLRGGTKVTPTMTSSGGNFFDDIADGFKSIVSLL
jgi:hypothetical protein